MRIGTINFLVGESYEVNQLAYFSKIVFIGNNLYWKL